MAALTHPTSPQFSWSSTTSFGVRTPTSVTSYSAPVAIKRILSFGLIVPFFTETNAIIPRYES